MGCRYLPARPVLGLIFAAALVLSYGGCGGGEGTTSGLTRRNELSGARESPVAGLPAQRKLRSAHNGACSRGEVKLDRASGGLRFRAVCVGHGKPKQVAIGLARRVQQYPGRSVGIGRFAKFAEVRGTYAGGRGAVRCRMRQGFIWCPLKVSAEGRTILAGRAWIRKGRVCKELLSVISSESMGLNVRSSQLFNDLPRGCMKGTN